MMNIRETNRDPWTVLKSFYFDEHKEQDQFLGGMLDWCQTKRLTFNKDVVREIKENLMKDKREKSPRLRHLLIFLIFDVPTQYDSKLYSLALRMTLKDVFLKQDPELEQLRYLEALVYRLVYAEAMNGKLRILRKQKWFIELTAKFESYLKLPLALMSVYLSEEVDDSLLVFHKDRRDVLLLYYKALSCFKVENYEGADVALRKLWSLVPRFPNVKDLTKRYMEFSCYLSGHSIAVWKSRMPRIEWAEYGLHSNIWEESRRVPNELVFLTEPIKREKARRCIMDMNRVATRIKLVALEREVGLKHGELEALLQDMIDKKMCAAEIKDGIVYMKECPTSAILDREMKMLTSE